MTKEELANLNGFKEGDLADAVLLTCRQHDNIMGQIRDGEALAQKLRKDHAVKVDELKAAHEEALKQQADNHESILAELKAKHADSASQLRATIDEHAELLAALGDHPTLKQMAKDARKKALQAELAKL